MAMCGDPVGMIGKREMIAFDTALRIRKQERCVINDRTILTDAEFL